MMPTELFICPKCEAEYRLTNEDHERDARVGPETVLRPVEIRHRCPDGKWRTLKPRQIARSEVS